jgi:predicted O-methyltransferase YrrM
MDQTPPSAFDWPACLEGTRWERKDYVTNKILRWSEVLSGLRHRSDVSILEIGSSEGRSALFFLCYMPCSRIVCIDPLQGALEPIFDHNLRRFEDRITKIRDFSFPALTTMRKSGNYRFDLIYIDGNHQRETVMLDSVLAWPMLKAGGILIWDDYIRYKSDRPSWERPTAAIDGFLVMHEGEFEELHRAKQVIVRKVDDSPSYNLDSILKRPRQD